MKLPLPDQPRNTKRSRRSQSSIRPTLFSVMKLSPTVGYGISICGEVTNGTEKIGAV